MSDDRASDVAYRRPGLPAGSSVEASSPPTGFISRVRLRLFPPSLPNAHPQAAGKTANRVAGNVSTAVKQKVGLQASLAELLLVNRLKARTQPDQAARMLERATHIIFVTCKHWFSHADNKPTRHETRL